MDMLIEILKSAPLKYTDMETLSILLTLCVYNPPVNGGFCAQRISNVELSVGISPNSNCKNSRVTGDLRP